MFVDTKPILFHGKVCGAMVRLSATPIVNVSSGGGETGFLAYKNSARPEPRLQFAEISLQQLLQLKWILRLAVTQTLKEFQGLLLSRVRI